METAYDSKLDTNSTLNVLIIRYPQWTGVLERMLTLPIPLYFGTELEMMMHRRHIRLPARKNTRIKTRS